MTDKPFEIITLGKQDRSGFCCGVDVLDQYFIKQVTQDVRRKVAACYLAIDTKTQQIAGYYTLSAADIPLADLPAEMIHKLPRYPAVPVARIGRLAVDQRYQGKKLGGALLLNAAMRALRSEIAVFALVVDAKDEKAADFYRHFHFSCIGATSLQFIAPIELFRKLLDGSE